MKNCGFQYRHIAKENSAQLWLSDYLTVEFPHSSRDVWLSRILAGELAINGNSTTTDLPLKPGQTIVWNRPPWDEETTPQKFEQIHVDAHLLIVDKPSGLPTIPGGGFFANTLLQLVRVDFPTAIPLHRLGRATSGLVIFALDQSTASRIQSNWSRVEKRYVALASGIASEDRYDIRCPIGQQPHHRLGSVWAAHPEGKPARSVARVIERRNGGTIFEVDLHTGRPHQIRIHLASIGHPLVGDPLYGVGGLPLTQSPGLPGDGGYLLRATHLSFTHPVSTEQIRVSAPVQPWYQAP